MSINKQYGIQSHYRYGAKKKGSETQTRVACTIGARYQLSYLRERYKACFNKVYEHIVKKLQNKNEYYKETVKC